MLKLIRSFFQPNKSVSMPIEEDMEEFDEDIDIEIEGLEFDENAIQSSVTFMISKKGSIDLNISWDDPDSITAQNLATILHIINSGGFEQHCNNLLINIANTQPSNANFIRECLQEWNKKKKKDPLIKPSEVFQFGTINQQE